MSKRIKSDLSEKSKAKTVKELVIANAGKAVLENETNKELILAKEKEKLVVELTIVNKELTTQIEKRKKAEEAVNFQEIKLELALQASQMGTWEFHIIENKRFFDKQACFLLGIDSATFGGTSEEFFAAVHPDDHEKIKGALKNTIEYNIFYNPEYRTIWHDGSIHHVSARGNLLYDDKGNPQMISGIIWDNTENQQKEEELKNSEKRFKTIFNQAPIAIALLDMEGHTIISNLLLSNMVGYSNEELSKMKFTDFTYHEDVDKDMYQFIELIEGRISDYRMEKRFVHKDGSIVWGNLFVTVIREENGMSKEFIGMAVNITARKQTEFELKKKIDEFESINKKLSETNVELILAKEKAEESDRLKSAFLTNMSHEIRTPMNGILGFAELLKEPNLSNDEVQDYIQTIQVSGARMLSTINSIVDIAKIESGLISIDIKETNLNEKIEFTYKFFKPEAENKGLRFLFKNGLSTNEAIIKTDNEKVYGILTNLVRNAIKFTYDGSIEFGYVLKSGSESGSAEQSRSAELEFFVKDTGIGIPKNQIQHIFERFRQGSESHTRDYEGSGLGLSICRSYIEMLGGRIWVESEEGLGSTFYFTIPYNPVSEEITTIGNDVYAAHEDKKLKILIVEDDEISYSLLSRTIQQISKKVLHAITGVEAVEICRNNPDLDLVLMDIRMPQMNGLEATQRIRQFNKDVIIIAQTAYAFTGDSEKALKAGCNDYITKPINRTLLLEIIKKHKMY